MELYYTGTLFFNLTLHYFFFFPAWNLVESKPFGAACGNRVSSSRRMLKQEGQTGCKEKYFPHEES